MSDLKTMTESRDFWEQAAVDENKQVLRLQEENASNKRVIEALGCQIKFERTKQCTQRFCSTRTVPSDQGGDDADS